LKRKKEFRGFIKALGDPNKKTLLPETKIGEFLSVGVEFEGEEVGLYLASADVSASCGFKIDEWESFITEMIRANGKLKELFE